jgi:hypothetical protein
MQQTEQHADGGRLAGGVRPEKPEDRAGRHFEVDAVHGEAVAEAPAERPGVNDRIAHH